MLRLHRVDYEDIARFHLIQLRGIKRALTSDAGELYSRCSNPGERLPSCLVGLDTPDDDWDLLDEQSYHLPVPARNIIRNVEDTLEPREWLELVARRCDAWLFSLTWFRAMDLTQDMRMSLVTCLAHVETVSDAVRNTKYDILPIDISAPQWMEQSGEEQWEASTSEPSGRQMGSSSTHLLEQTNSLDKGKSIVVEITSDDSSSAEEEMVDEIISRYKQRLQGIKNAVTRDAKKLYKRCSDPSKPATCLVPMKDGKWELQNELKYSLPVPAEGIIRYRNDRLPAMAWLRTVGRCSDAWLGSLVWYEATKLKDVNNRISLVKQLAEIPTARDAQMKEIGFLMDYIRNELSPRP